jgi:hypothetical protein
VDLLVQHGGPSSMTSALVELYSKLVRRYLMSHLFYLMDGIDNVYCNIGAISVNVPKDFLFSFTAFSFGVCVKNVNIPTNNIIKGTPEEVTQKIFYHKIIVCAGCHMVNIIV